MRLYFNYLQLVLAVFLLIITSVVLAQPPATAIAPHKEKGQDHSKQNQPDTSTINAKQVSPLVEAAQDQEDWDEAEVEQQKAAKKADIVVTASRPKVATSATQKVMGGTELVVKSSNSLGETLNMQLGFSSSSYGQAAARPIIRGMEGARVRILNNGTELMDASNVSHDHAAAVEPLLADKIEFSRGPSDLAYGGGAIGGVVNVIDNKIPRYVPEKLEGSLQVEAGTSAQDRIGAFSLTGGWGKVAWHLDGLDRLSQNYHVGRDWYFTKKITAPAKTPGGSWSGLDTYTIKQEKEKVPASYNGTDTLSLGGSYVFNKGYFGMSYTKQRNHYGIPGHSHPFEFCYLVLTRDRIVCEDIPKSRLPHHDEEAANIRLNSNRWEVRGELREVSKKIDKITTNFNITDYLHTEYHGGEEQTKFKNKGFDSRIELEHQALFWQIKGLLGGQLFKRKFTILGEEKGYIAPTITNKYALYWLGEKQFNPRLSLNAGIRYDSQRVKVDSKQPNSKHYGMSFSLAGKWQYKPEHSVSLSYTHNTRMPSAEELYADGVHFAAGLWELGDPSLNNEQANNLDLTLSGNLTNYGTSYNLTAYHNQIKDYIYARTLDSYPFAGPLLRYSQDDAVFNGFELELKQIFNNGIGLRVFSDYVQAKLTNVGENVPRLAPWRYGTTFYASLSNWLTEIELYRVSKQTKIAPYETETAGYNMLNAKFSYNITTKYGDLQFYTKASNLLNKKVIYPHTSVVKERAPLMGRNISLGVKLVF